eukprot:CAMPEP_0178397046 /NCGR_PEP_ID=MMETSP0689_2-20121128/14043_1 /TAXON_ID=160604 /ORGANISM="Amphidinium massartii, Strain CS-259" /LENGTH=754 /DNA_ID=CAMNT_0020017741 /DNA_START=14 /DNA_END=2281 /DNA_ORIENTATION=+
MDAHKTGVTVYPGYRKELDQVIPSIGYDRLHFDDARLPVVEEVRCNADAEETSDEETRPSSFPSSPEASHHEERHIESQVLLASPNNLELDEAFMPVDPNIHMRAAMQANLEILTRRLKGQDTPSETVPRLDSLQMIAIGANLLEKSPRSRLSGEALTPECPDAAWQAVSTAASSASLHEPFSARATATEPAATLAKGAGSAAQANQCCDASQQLLQHKRSQTPSPPHPLQTRLAPQEISSEPTRGSISPKSRDRQRLTSIGTQTLSTTPTPIAPSSSSTAAAAAPSSSCRSRASVSGPRDLSRAQREVQALQAEIAMQEVQLRGLLTASDGSDEEAFRANRLLHDLESIRTVIATLQEHLASSKNSDIVRRIDAVEEEGLESIFSVIASLREHMSGAGSSCSSSTAAPAGPSRTAKPTSDRQQQWDTARQQWDASRAPNSNANDGGRFANWPTSARQSSAGKGASSNHQGSTAEAEARSRPGAFRGLLRGSGTGGGAAAGGKRGGHTKPGMDRQVHTAPSTPGGDRFHRPTAPLRGTIVQGGSAVANPSTAPQQPENREKELDSHRHVPGFDRLAEDARVLGHLQRGLRPLLVGVEEASHPQSTESLRGKEPKQVHSAALETAESARRLALIKARSALGHPPQSCLASQARGLLNRLGWALSLITSFRDVDESLSSSSTASGQGVERSVARVSASTLRQPIAEISFSAGPTPRSNVPQQPPPSPMPPKRYLFESSAVPNAVSTSKGMAWVIQP